MRDVPLYSDFIKERFERCLDLYLCPRVRRKRVPSLLRHSLLFATAAHRWLCCDVAL
jgi:hypothetical protein